MRIATFNLDSLDMPPRAAVPLERRFAVLQPQLERLAADVLCLQEVNGQRRPGAPHRSLDALDALLTGTAYADYGRATSLGPDGVGVAAVHNVVTLSRWPIMDVSRLRNDLVPPLKHRQLTAVPPDAAGAPLGFERPVLVCDIQVSPKRTVTVLNVHLRAPLATPIPGQKESAFVWRSISGWAEGYVLSAWKRAAQALEARLAIDHLLDADPQRVVIVAGDFNAEDHETPLRVLVGADDDTGNGLLAARSLVVLDRSLPADRRFSTVHHGRPQMLDHILVTRPHLAHLRTIEVHNEALGDELVGYGKVANAAGSYHAPVLAEFAFS